MVALVGETIGRYHITEQLGAGGMAIVYKAYDMHLHRNVALKVVLPHYQQTDEFLRRFEREAQSLAQLTHPNIVGVIDYGEYKDMPYLVMEYVSSGNLKRLTGAPVPVKEAARLVLPVARALEAAHQLGIVHRDVKPANILLTSTGDVMLSDFGIAKILDSEDTANLTGTGLSIGTPEYMAPEQATAGQVDQRADIYALGIVLYELLTGITPYHADTPVAVLLKQASEPLPRPRQFVPDLPEAVEQVLFKALAKQPDERFQTMGEFATALETAASAPAPVQTQTLPVKAAAPGRSDMLLRAGIPLGILGIAGVLFVIAALFVVFFIWRPFDTTAAVPEPSATATFDQLSPSAVPIITATPTQTAEPSLTPSPTVTISPTPTRSAPVVLQNPADAVILDRVPAGEFVMGSDPDVDPYFWGAEFPQRTVLLDYDYYIYHTEVTNDMYRLCVQSGACQAPARSNSMTRTSYYDDPEFADYPVVYVTWEAAQAYCRWAGGRLPSEAEWEKAARGTDGRLFPWGDQEANGTLVNYCDSNCTGTERNNDNDGYADTAPVGSFPENASSYGALDMAGNVLEWVNDWFQPYYYESAPDVNPPGPEFGDNGLKVTRGGSFFQSAASMRVVGRTPRGPNLAQESIGFRCVLDQLP